MTAQPLYHTRPAGPLMQRLYITFSLHDGRFVSYPRQEAAMSVDPVDPAAMNEHPDPAEARAALHATKARMLADLLRELAQAQRRAEQIRDLDVLLAELEDEWTVLP